MHLALLLRTFNLYAFVCLSFAQIHAAPRRQRFGWAATEGKGLHVCLLEVRGVDVADTVRDGAVLVRRSVRREGKGMEAVDW
ncbi:hypothetical protein BDV98DRAFT_574973 [Pterulicium gracile]|uniref:Secreted protein n=1 Tax=Pterulicium gracile TaxID=1884261 RepID=A0A5C3Q4Z3_9AGAR|nr:hypothetical protein BDV98DRAFT_574973 [Pterula gracilis]